MRGDKPLRFGEQIDIKVIASAAEKQGNDSEIFQSPDRRLPRKIRHQISRRLWHRSSQIQPRRNRPTRRCRACGPYCPLLGDAGRVGVTLGGEKPAKPPVGERHRRDTA
jgi:hypothetical protein